MAAHSSTLAWKIPWMEEPGRSLGVGHNWATSLSLFTFMHWKRKWQPTPVFLPGESQGRGSLVGCRLWGCTESDTTEAMQQQQQQTHLGNSKQNHLAWMRGFCRGGYLERSFFFESCSSLGCQNTTMSKWSAYVGDLPGLLSWLFFSTCSTNIHVS